LTQTDETKRTPSPNSSSSDAYRRIPFPPERRLVLDTLRLGHNKPMMHGFMELDVTRARQLLRAHRLRTGESISFTAFILACLGKAVAAHPEVHALRDWFGRLVMFEDVDATTIVEVKTDGRPFALAHVVHGINRRTVRDIHEEIRAVQSSGMSSLPVDFRKQANYFLMVPGVLRRLLYRIVFCRPTVAKKHLGTMLVTAVGMFGNGAGWGQSAPGFHNFSVVVGGIATRPATTVGELGPREILCLTVSANHDLVDGAPFARFAHKLQTIIEAAEGLDEATVPTKEEV